MVMGKLISCMEGCKCMGLLAPGMGSDRFQMGMSLVHEAMTNRSETSFSFPELL